MYEIQYALDKSAREPHGANIVPIMLREPTVTQRAMPEALQLLLKAADWFDFSQGDFDDNIRRLVAHMKSRAMD